jgi:hypothetical protein
MCPPISLSVYDDERKMKVGCSLLGSGDFPYNNDDWQRKTERNRKLLML